jgi:hypothetical protein
MPVQLHRCSNMWVKFGGHPCWRVQKELDAAGIEYEVVKGPYSRSKRTETIEKTGQSSYPWIEFEDGGVLREPSKELAARIKSGHLFDGHQTGEAAPPASA